MLNFSLRTFCVLRSTRQSDLQMSCHLSSLVIHLADCLLDSQWKGWASPLKVRLYPTTMQNFCSQLLALTAFELHLKKPEDLIKSPLVLPSWTDFTIDFINETDLIRLILCLTGGAISGCLSLEYCCTNKMYCIINTFILSKGCRLGLQNRTKS